MYWRAPRDTLLGEHLGTLFTDAELFNFEKVVSCQNNRMFPPETTNAVQRDLVVNRSGHPSSAQEAPAHKAKTTQDSLKNSVPEFILTFERSSYSPDLSFLDYFVSKELKEKACSTARPNLNLLRTDFRKACNDMDNDYLLALVESYSKRLKSVFKAKGDRALNFLSYLVERC